MFRPTIRALCCSIRLVLQMALVAVMEDKALTTLLAFQYRLLYRWLEGAQSQLSRSPLRASFRVQFVVAMGAQWG